MNIKKAAAAAVVTVGIGAGMVLGGAPASAAINPWTVSTTGAKVNFWEDGDVFRLYDTSADGKAVHFDWYMPYNGDAGSGSNSGGSGTNVKFDSRNLVDGKLINICVWRTGGAATCGTTTT